MDFRISLRAELSVAQNATQNVTFRNAVQNAVPETRQNAQNAAKTQFQNAKRRIDPSAAQNAEKARDMFQNAAKTQTQNACFETQVSKRKRRTQPKRRPRDAKLERARDCQQKQKAHRAKDANQVATKRRAVHKWRKRGKPTEPNAKPNRPNRTGAGTGHTARTSVENRRGTEHRTNRTR